MPTYDKVDIERLIDGILPWPAVQEMMRSPKDEDRFDLYVSILQDRVDWDDPILLPLTPQLYIVAKNKGKKRIVKCKCGHEFGDYRINWKLNALINVRDDEQSIEEIYKGRELPDHTWVQLREYICPGCGSQLEVEAVPRGCPPDFEFLPDLDTFYKKWLRRPLAERSSYEDRTLSLISEWKGFAEGHRS